MSNFATLPVKTYRVFNDWLQTSCLETPDFEEACEAKARFEQTNQHDEFLILAVIDA
jgi:hypothetical protein